MINAVIAAYLVIAAIIAVLVIVVNFRIIRSIEGQRDWRLIAKVIAFDSVATIVWPVSVPAVLAVYAYRRRQFNSEVARLESEYAI